MKTVFVPLYMPVAYQGATPAPYLSSLVDGYERKLVALSGVLFRHDAMMLTPALDGRFVGQRPVKAYAFSGDVDAVINMTLKHYNLPSVCFVDEDGFAYNATLDAIGEAVYKEVKAPEAATL